MRRAAKPRTKLDRRRNERRIDLDACRPAIADKGQATNAQRIQVEVHLGDDAGVGVAACDACSAEPAARELPP